MPRHYANFTLKKSLKFISNVLVHNKIIIIALKNHDLILEKSITTGKSYSKVVTRGSAEKRLIVSVDKGKCIVKNNDNIQIK